MTLLDMKGFRFSEGCTVARAVMWGKSPVIELCTVTRIENGRMYLNESKQHIRFPERLLIVEQDKLTRLVLDYDRATQEEHNV